MKLKNLRYEAAFYVLAGVMLYILIGSQEALADTGISSGRRIWNNIMLWVNFGILAFLFVKYAKKPLMGYLRSVKQKVEENLNTINREVQTAKTSMEAENRKLQEIEEHLEEIKARITEIGQAERERIVESGRTMAQEMIENAKAYANYRLSRAKKKISDELVDNAVSMAAETLRKGISQEDSDKLVAKFFTDLEASKKRLRKKISETP
ncbi:MAG: ATP synthase F0 subunit B [Deltaproteobacteria bacterium]